MLTNAQLAELMAVASPLQETDTRVRALARASRKAFVWTEQAADVLASGRPLTALEAVGPWVAGVLLEMFESDVQPPEPSPERANFLTRADARAVLDMAPRLRGDLQMHTTWSDGGGTLAEMAAAAIDAGHEYISITDHSKGLKIAGGMTEDELAAQGREIDELNEALSGRLRVLRSIEMNLDPEGQGDMEPSSLQALDIVLGSFHSKLRLSEDQTPRYLAALDNPHLRILGHPRGRMYDRRKGLDADWEAVFERAAQRDVAVEVDSFPDRQDLDVGRLRLAAQAGCRISVGTDSHAPFQLASHLEYGLASLVLAEVPPEQVLNTMPADELVAWAKR